MKIENFILFFEKILANNLMDNGTIEIANCLMINKNLEFIRLECMYSFEKKLWKKNNNYNLF